MSAKDWAIDVAITAAAFLFGCMQLVLVTSSFIMPDEVVRHALGIEAIVPSPAAYLAVTLTVVPLVLRRRFPWPVFLFTMVMFVLMQSSFRGYSLTIVGPLIALYTVASTRPRTEIIVASALALLGIAFSGSPAQSITLTFLTRFQNMAFMVAAALGGYAIKTHHAYVRATEQRALEAERTREEEAARRVEEERVRIAREVHDITAHSLSAVSIQAAAAERLLERDPDAAKEAIATARRTAKEALEEIRSMIGVLRQGEAAETEPTTGTDRMCDLAEYLDDAGIKTTLDMSRYTRERVPVYVDVALYGIAREAVTNIVRHSQASAASIYLSLVEDGVCLQIRDNGRASLETRADKDAAKDAAKGVAKDATQDAAKGIAKDATKDAQKDNSSAGHGIIGMKERAKLLGGTLSAEPCVGGGFLVEAHLPCAKGE